MSKVKPKTLEEWHEQFRKEADEGTRLTPKMKKVARQWIKKYELRLKKP